MESMLLYQREYKEVFNLCNVVAHSKCFLVLRIQSHTRTGTFQSFDFLLVISMCMLPSWVPEPYTQGWVTQGMYVLTRSLMTAQSGAEFHQKYKFTRVYSFISNFQEHPIFIQNKFLSSCFRFFFLKCVLIQVYRHFSHFCHRVMDSNESSKLPLYAVQICGVFFFFAFVYT